jgi:hypothetical protein
MEMQQMIERLLADREHVQELIRTNQERKEDKMKEVM